MPFSRHSSRRIATFILILFLLWLLVNTLEVRQTAYSCRTLRTCLGLGPRYPSRHPALFPSELVETQKILQDGTTRYDLVNPTLTPTLLLLVLTKDETSWSSDFRSQPRSVHDFLAVLRSTDLDFATISVAFTTSSPSHFDALKAALPRLPFARITIFHSADVQTGVIYTDRHASGAQLARRSALASMRNQLMLRSIADEQHLLWLDADVVELSPGIVQRMLLHSEQNENAGIITAECHQNQMDNYDKNAWKLSSSSQSRLLGPIADGDRENAVNELVATRDFVPALIDKTIDDDLFALDSVGGTILYIRADLVRQGVTFPLYNAVGTTWSQAGWIGVETEGICYVARSAKGGGCYVLGGSHHVRHTDWG